MELEKLTTKELTTKVENRIQEIILKLVKERSRRWFDDVEIEIRALSLRRYLVILRNAQGNHTDHYAGQAREHLKENLLYDVEVKVVFFGPKYLCPGQDEAREEKEWLRKPPPQAPARPPHQSPWHLEE